MLDDNPKLESLELNLLLDAIFQKYGYDFRNYAAVSLSRRIKNFITSHNYNYISDLIPKILHDKNFFNTFFLDTNIHVTEMFRDPLFFKQLQEKVIRKILRSYPFLRIWVAGCSTGEEVYSLAILLNEEGLYDRVQIYATDFNEVVIKKAKEGVFPAKDLKGYIQNYRQAGGTGSFGDYFHVKYDFAKIDNSLKRNITFSFHNLCTDSVFGEMHLILCRNVLIYFNQILQNRVLNLFSDSLCYNGILCLGDKETIKFSNVENHYIAISEREKIYQKKFTN